MRKHLAAICIATIGGILQGTPAGAQVNMDTATAQQQPAPIRATTRLVQVSVVVTDKKGLPVTGLKKEDFTVLDESKPQEIAFFSAEAPAPPGAPAALPPNAFTNRFDLKGEDPGAVTIILFDAENTATEDQFYVRQQVMKLLRSLKSQDHVALYALTSQLLILHDFTQDNSALVDAVNKFAPKDQMAFDGSLATKITFPNLGTNPQWRNLDGALETPNRQMGNQYIKIRVQTTTAALKAIAEHVASIPGRKSLLWVSGGFPIQMPLPSIGRPSGYELAVDLPMDHPVSPQGCTDNTNQLACVEEETGTFDDQVKQAVRELNRANVVMYPVDAHGVAVDPNISVGGPGAGISASGRGSLDPAQTTATLSAEQDTRDSSKQLADQTGGVAFFGTNDVSDALKRAFDDSRYAYTIGFYPTHGTWDGKYRKIKVQAKVTDGVKLRYRTGYFAEAEGGNMDESKTKEAMQLAAMSPLDATSLSLIVSGMLSGTPADRKVELHVALDPKQLVMQDADNHRKGAVDLYLVQRDEKGQTVAAENQKIGLNLEEKQYEYLVKAGLVLARHLTIAPQAAELRVLLRDTSSEALGSVTVPIPALLAAQASTPPPAPPKMENPK